MFSEYSNNKSSIDPGIYRHFKGKYYEVFNVGTDLDSAQTVVIYGALDGSCSFYQRPMDKFIEVVSTKSGSFVARFAKIDDVHSDSIFRNQTIDCKELESKITTPLAECPSDSLDNVGEINIIGVTRDSENHDLVYDIFSIHGEPGLFLQHHAL
jgi:hypothetical protein